jgi:hypothetical protein
MTVWTKEMWEAAMELALVTEIPADGGFRSSTSTRPKGPTYMEIPGEVPSGGGAPSDTVGGKNLEIPKDGGFTATPAAGHPHGPMLMEIPGKVNDKPGSYTPLDWASLLDALGKMFNGDPVHYAGPDEGKNRFEPPNKSKTTTDDGTHGEHLAMSDGSFFILNLGDLKAAIDRVKSMDDVSLDPVGRYQAIKDHIVRRAQHIVPQGWQNLVPANWQLSLASLNADMEECDKDKKKKDDDDKEEDAKKKNLPPWLKKKGDGDDDKDDKDDKKDDKKKEKDSVDAYMDRDFSTDDRERLAKSGAAMPGGRYPIENKADLHNAIQAYGRGKEGDKAAIRAHILSRAKALGVDNDLVDHIQHLGVE